MPPDVVVVVAVVRFARREEAQARQGAHVRLDDGAALLPLANAEAEHHRQLFLPHAREQRGTHGLPAVVRSALLPAGLGGARAATEPTT